MTFLEDHQPARRQFRHTRRAEVTGAICIHTAENTVNRFLPADGGAEAVARFIARRTDAAGSYHSIVDSDSVVHLGRYEWEMFGEGTGGNRWALHLSFACRASQWPSLPLAWVDGAMEQGAAEAARMARWVHDTTGVTIPAETISVSDYRAGRPGFIGHGQVDPARRTDPGESFPWGRFLGAFARHMKETTMTTPVILDSDPHWTLAAALDEVDAIYFAWTGQDAGIGEREAWARALSHAVYGTGDDTIDDILRFIAYRLELDAKAEQ